MICAKSVTKSFENIQALDGLDINVPEGAIYGLVGPNGSGKSTFIRTMMGIYRQNSGEILIDGAPIYENPDIKQRLGYIPDDLYFFLQAGTRDMMKYYKGIYPKFDCDRYEKLKEVFHIDEKTPMRRLSKGMQKQAAFWLVMSMRPDILVLDEPVDGLDPVMRRQVWSIIMGDVAEHGTTVLISSHNLRELEDVCDHVGIIYEGKTLLERSLSELQENIVKVQIVYGDAGKMPEGLNILHESSIGKVHTHIVRGRRQEIENAIAMTNPLFYDLVPLTLEEIFIYELGGAEYAVKDIVL